MRNTHCRGQSKHQRNSSVFKAAQLPSGHPPRKRQTKLAKIAKSIVNHGRKERQKPKVPTYH